MGILELQGFKAQAEVLGRTAAVEWDGVRLIVEDVDLDFAKRMLDRLALGTLTVVDPMVGDTLEKPMPPPPDPQVRLGPVAPVPEAPVVATPAPAQSAPAPAPAADPTPAVSKQPTKLLFAEPSGYLKSLQQCTKLRDVLNIMRDKMGIEGEAALVAECEAKKSDVPTLRAIPNIKERVARTLAIMEGRD